MNKIRRISVAAASVLLAGVVHGANDRLTSLNDAVERGSVDFRVRDRYWRLQRNVINAVLVNGTAMAQRILVHLNVPLFFRNRGVAQNMAATQVYGHDGSYRQHGDGIPYVEVEAGARLPVTFIAYCADFEKDNPSAADAFDVAPLPQRVSMVMRQISAYETANRDVGTTKASQLALWVAQGHTLDAIGERFGFGGNDTAIMHAILATPVD